jgi:hypothetical protein
MKSDPRISIKDYQQAAPGREPATLEGQDKEEEKASRCLVVCLPPPNR